MSDDVVAAVAAGTSGELRRGGLPRPLILVRGFGGFSVEDEQRNAYQGFNEGTVYPGRRGQNFIYEGFVLRALKSPRHGYFDATNVVGYYARDVEGPDSDTDLHGFSPEDVGGSTIVIDAATADLVLREGLAGTIWVYRYYDLDTREMRTSGRGLALDLPDPKCRARAGASVRGRRHRCPQHGRSRRPRSAPLPARG